MKLLSNAIIFKATLPQIDDLSTHLLELEHKGVQEHAMQGFGFIVNELTGEMVTPISGGYAFQLRIDSKVLPSDVINTEVAKRIKVLIEQNCGMPIKKKDKQWIKSEVITELLPTALVRTKIINAFYDEESKYLVVDTARKAIAGIVISSLIKVCGSVKTETIHISNLKHGLTQKLKLYMEGDDALNGFNTGSFCKLTSVSTGEKKTYDGADIEDKPEKILQDIEDGFEVTDIQLSRNGLKFKLTSNFELKSFKFKPVDVDKDDLAWSYRQESATKVIQIVDVVNSIVSLVEYK